MQRNRLLGFTLVELLMTITIAGILLAIGVPSFNTFLIRNRVAAQANDLVSAITAARFEAIKRGTRVAVCRSDPASSPRVCATGGNWGQGWMVFVDSIDDGQRASTEAILREQGAALTGYSIVGNAGVEGVIRFVPTGMPRSGTITGGGPEANWTVCAPSGSGVSGTTLSINVTGRLRRDTAACS